MFRGIAAILTLGALGCARLPAPNSNVDGGLRTKSALGVCVDRSLSTVPEAKYLGTEESSGGNTFRRHQLRLYETGSEQGLRFIPVLVSEKSCRDGTYYLFISAWVAGTVHDADGEAIGSRIDAIENRILSTCNVEALSVDRAGPSRASSSLCPA